MIGGATNRLNVIDKEIAELKREIKSLKELTNGEAVTKAREDSALLHDIYRGMMLKMMVFTEVNNSNKTRRDVSINMKIIDGLAMAMDYPDSWWFERRSITLGEWNTELLEVYEDNKTIKGMTL